MKISKSKELTEILLNIFKKGNRTDWTRAGLIYEIKKRYNLLYKVDYTPGIFSGVLYSMCQKGIIINISYGCYKLNETIESIDSHFLLSQEKDPVGVFSSLLSDTAFSIEAGYIEFCSKLQKCGDIHKKDISPEELSYIQTLLQIKKSYKRLLDVSTEYRF